MESVSVHGVAIGDKRRASFLIARETEKICLLRGERMIGKIIGTIIGGLTSLASAFGIYKLINFIVSGVTEQDWLKVIAGGVLAYLFIGILVVCFCVGLIILFLSLAD